MAFKKSSKQNERRREVFIIVLPAQNRCLLEQLFHLRTFSWQKPQVLCTEQRPMAFLELKTLVQFYNNIYKCLSCFKGQMHRMLRLT